MREKLLGLVALLVVLVVAPGIGGYIETHYTREGVVVEVNDDEVVVVDKTGNEWVFFGDGFEVDDEVKMSMFNGCTDNTLKDDEIVNVKKM